jgi:hypothetical protein
MYNDYLEVSMKRQMFLATAFSAALAVGAAAQTGTGTQPGSQQTVTVTGCLQQATPSGSAGTSGTATGTAGAASADSKFILTNAKVEGGSGSTAGSTGTATSGTSGTAGASAMGNRYKLSGGDEDDLKKYLNSQVEIRGTLDAKDAMAGSSSAGSASSGTGTGSTGTRAGQSSSDENLPTLHVTSVRQVAETCSGR